MVRLKLDGCWVKWASKSRHRKNCSLSTCNNKKRLDILRRTADLGMISYDATPTCDVYDSRASESCSGSEDEQAAMSEDEDGAFDETGRIGNTDWCQCGCCAQMPTAEVCVCCHEYPAAASRQPGCLTSNPDFETVCLNSGVLEVAYFMMRHYRQDGMGTTAHE
ncbi:uncharacterized protein LOC120840196 [Ixodes scapularis]|uniref:uncharacterized protein LOC120840196 n=1 Tax=Ixodes scapularis TaxID=6945 RepID=UPI001C38325B|nr:uncharacterized protein LOC120840196 [Ixodes scapularis]